MEEEEGAVVVVNSDVAMSTSDQAAADSEEGALSDVNSQRTENKGGETDIIIESVNIDAAASAEEEDNAEEEEENFEIEPELEPLSPKKLMESKGSGTEDDNASKHSDGQLTTDNEDDEMEHFAQNQNSNGENFEDNGLNFRPPLNAFNGNLEYTVSQNVLIEGEGFENRLHNIRQNIQHLFNQLNIFRERLTDSENFDVDEFSATFLEMSTLIAELSVVSREFDELHEKVSSEYFKCLDKYEENANICGGHLLNAKLNKARQIRDLINSWNQSAEILEAQITENAKWDDENEPNSYYDNCHGYQILSRNLPYENTGYRYVADIPPPVLPPTFFVPPTALPSFSGESINMNAYNDDSDNERTTELPTDLLPANPPPVSNAPLISNPPEQPAPHNSPSPYTIPPMISIANSLSFNTPPKFVASNILPPMNIPPPLMNLTPQNIQSQSNVLPQSNIPTSDPKILLPPFQSNNPMPPKAAPVLIPGLNIANTAPLFAQAPSGNTGMLSDSPLIPTQLPTVPLVGANYGNVRKHNPQIAPIINLNLSTIGAKSPAQNQISQSTSSSHIPSLLSIEVPFPIEILKRNQSQAQQQRFNNRSRRSPVVNSESKESTSTKEKESQSVKSDEPMDSTEQQSLITEETPDDPINDNPGLKRLLYKTVAAFYFHSMYPQVYSTDGVFVQPAIYLPIRSVNGYLTYYPHPVSSMTPPMGTPIPSYYASSPLTIMSGGAVSPIQNGSIGEGPAQMRKLFIGGLNHETTDEQLREYYSQWGAVVDCIVIRDPVTKQSRGFGFVTYATIQMAEAAMNGRPHTINGKVVDPKRAIPREQMLPMTANNPPYFLEVEPQQDCKVILSGIHWDYHTVDGLRQHFETFGSVEQIEILGHPRGFGFVVFEDKESVSRCKAHGKQHTINGKKVEVKTDPSLDLPSAASVYSKRRHNLSGSQGYVTQQHSSTATPDSICSTEYTSSDDIRSEDHSETNNLQTTPTF